MGCDVPTTPLPRGITFTPMKSRYTLGEVITYSCRYSDIKDTTTITCKNDGTFTKSNGYPQCNAGCPTRNGTVVKNTCYILYTNARLSHEDAELKCEENEGHLAYIEDVDVYDAVE